MFAKNDYAMSVWIKFQLLIYRLTSSMDIQGKYCCSYYVQVQEVTPFACYSDFKTVT